MYTVLPSEVTHADDFKPLVLLPPRSKRYAVAVSVGAKAAVALFYRATTVGVKTIKATKSSASVMHKKRVILIGRMKRNIPAITVSREYNLVEYLR